MSTPISDPDLFAPLPDGRLDPEWLRKAARRLLKDVQAGNPVALRRMTAVHPAGVPEPVKLADALWVVAREAGFSSWPKLRRHADRQAFLRHRIEGGTAPVPDTAETLHLRCGSDIRRGLEIAGFRGRFVEFSDPFCHGPVSAGDDLPTLRRAYLQGAYGLDPADAEARVARSYHALARALEGEGGPLVLWFEHDAYDQLILAYLLWRLWRHPPRRAVEMICVSSVPGIPRFTGLGQLSPESLLMLWETRRVPVSAVVMAAGAAVWRRFADGDIAGLARIAADGLPGIPEMAAAVARHLQELPAVGSGLGLTQSLTLSLLAEAGEDGLTAGLLFRRLSRQREPLPWLGDMMYWRELADLLQSNPPVLSCQGSGHPWPERRLVLTETGRDVLSGRQDFMVLTTARRWFGPVVIGPGYRGPRWDRQGGVVVVRL